MRACAFCSHTMSLGACELLLGLLVLDMRATLHTHGLSWMHYTIGIFI